MTHKHLRLGADRWYAAPTSGIRVCGLHAAVIESVRDDLAIRRLLLPEGDCQFAKPLDGGFGSPYWERHGAPHDPASASVATCSCEVGSASRTIYGKFPRHWRERGGIESHNVTWFSAVRTVGSVVSLANMISYLSP